MTERNGALVTRLGPEITEIPLERLEAEICELAGHLWAAECRWLLMVEEFDRREAWAGWGMHSCAHWLSWRCGLALAAAREKVRVARRLPGLPLITEAFSKGELSYAKVRALTRVANEANEPELLKMARAATASQLERIVRAYRPAQVMNELAEANERHRGRRVSWSWDDDGSLVVSARLSPEDGAVFLEALEAGRDAARSAPGDMGEDVSAETSHPAVGNADAFVGVARLALSAVDRDDRGDAPYQVVVHVDAAVLASDEADGRGHLEDGPRLPAETLRRLSCDAAVVAATGEAGSDSPLHLGRKTRTIPPALRRALRSRDGGCRYPGCSQRRFVDGHHIVHWGRGGLTELANLLLLCRRHHRLVHEAGYGVASPQSGRFVFTRPDGRVVPDAPALEPPPAGPDLRVRNGAAGITVEPGTCRSLGEGERFDLSMAIDALLCAELRRRGRTWGIPRPPGPDDGDTRPIHERIAAAVPEFAPLVEGHVAAHGDVPVRALADAFSEFVVEAHQAGDRPVVTRCLDVLDAAVPKGDADELGEAATLVRAFIYTACPWEPDAGAFVATWPPALRRYGKAMVCSYD